MNKKNWERSVRPIKLLLFFGALAVLCLIGLVLPRPTVSELEKRELTEFPAVTCRAFGTAASFPPWIPGMPIPIRCGSR